MEENKFQLFHWTVVADMTYDAANDICSLCNKEIVDRCSSCDKGKTDTKCVIVRGTCMHAFHEHCLRNQTGTSIICPIDKTEWKTECDDMSLPAEKYSKKKVVKK